MDEGRVDLFWLPLGAGGHCVRTNAGCTRRSRLGSPAATDAPSTTPPWRSTSTMIAS